MAEYYQYGIPSEEWLTLQADQPSAAPPGSQTIQELQAATNAGRETSSSRLMALKDLSNQVTWSNVSIPTRDGSTIPARIYRPSQCQDAEELPMYVFFHGGGFMFGTIDSEDYNCARVVSLVPVILIHICYRHTPAFSHPTQANDAQDGFEWAVSHAAELGGDANRIIIGGISAGGSLAASIVLRENQNSPGKGRISGQLLAIPWLQHPEVSMQDGNSSYAQNKHAPILPLAQILRFSNNLGVANIRDETLFAANARDADFIAMPKTLVLVAGMDVLRDEALHYEQRLREQGVHTKLHVFSGLPHGFYRHAELSSAEEWFRRMAAGIRWMIDHGNN